MDEDILDGRFTTLLKDPKFKKLRKQDKKIKIDKRFQSMFKSDAFKVKYTVDKRGKPVTVSSSEDYKQFYDLSSEEEFSDGSIDSSDNECQVTNYDFDKEKICGFPAILDNEKNKKFINENIRQKLMDMKVDYARGEGKLFSDSSSDESESEGSDNESLYHEWNELDRDADVTNHITNRLAICNMDWDRIRAVDLMMMLNSFLPSGAVIHSIVIYPSEYGLKRMQEEEYNGPAEFINASQKSNSDSENEHDENIHMELMRKYQMNRLKYYYAVATFDSPETADRIYNICNGVEFESSGIRLDLRFIDDGITFDQEPKDQCKSSDDYEKYEPRFFINTALQQAKVELTWDETDPRRLEFTQKINEVVKNRDVNDSDLEDYVALSSEEENEDSTDNENEKQTYEAVILNSENEEDDDDPISTYRKLLKEIETNEKNNQEEEQLEISWGSGNAKTIITKTDESSKCEDNKLTPFERLIEIKKSKSKLSKIKMKKIKEEESVEDELSEKLSKKKKKYLPEIDEKQKQELELLLMDENNDGKHHFNLKKIKESKVKKNKKKFENKNKKSTITDDFQIDVNDERFSAIYSSHLYNIDPTNPKFHKTKGMETLIEEKMKRISQTRDEVKDFVDEPPSKMQKVASDKFSSLTNYLKDDTKTALLNKSKKLR